MAWRAHISRYGATAWPGGPWALRALLAIVLLGAVLRFWDLPHLPYTHDELSALSRLHPTLSQTITEGVIANDTHPPGVQVFEWFWTRAFSLKEADVKLPFILMSLAAIVLLYRFAIAWTGTGAALVLATLMATLQYSVFYGQLARPYAAGLFTTALLADQLTRWLASGHRRAWAGACAAMIASAYVHHFSLLLAAVMGASALLLCTGPQRRSWLIACAIAMALYLPNVPILLKQLGLGGLDGWLPPPSKDWIPHYAGYIAHWSPFLGGALLILLSASVVLVLRKGGSAPGIRWMLLLWGTIPLILGFAYSVWRAPVLQYSVVLFSFPYLALFALQGLMHLSRNATLASCALLAAMAVHSLVTVRKHYIVTYHSKYEAILRTGIDATKALGRDRVLTLIDAPYHMIDFYKRHWGVPEGELNEVNILGMPQARVDSILAAHPGDQVVLGRSNGAHDENPALVQQRYPRLAHRRDLVEGQVLRFSRTPVDFERFDRDTVAHLSRSAAIGPWQVDEWLTTDSAGWVLADKEFGIVFHARLDSLVLCPDDIIEVVMEVDGCDERTDAAVVAELRAGENALFYRTGELQAGPRPSGRASLVVAVSPSYLHGHERIELRTYAHNRSKGPLRVRRFMILRRDANPVRDAVLEPVPWLGRFPPE